MKPRLASITLDHFRGATQRVCVEFSDKPVTLIFGENGSGKSSLIDGLELVLKGRPGSIASISGATTGSHLAALNSKSSQIYAEAKLTDGSTCSASVKGNSISTQSTCDPVPYAAILRRSEILSLVTDMPSKRYEALASFINVAGVETAEEQLKKAIDEQMAALERKRQDVQHAFDEIERLHRENCTEDERSITPAQWAARHAGVDVQAERRQAQLLSEGCSCFDISESEVAECEKQQSILDAKRTEEKEAKEAFENVIRSSPIAAELLVDLLSAGKAYVEALPDMQECPICTQPANRDDVLAAIASRLAAIPGVAEAKTKYDSAVAVVKTEVSRTGDCYNRLLRSAVRLFSIVQSLPPDARGAIDLADAKLATLAAPQPILTQETIAASKLLVCACRPFRNDWEQRGSKLQERNALITSIAVHHKTLTAGQKEAETYEKLHQHLSAIFKIVRPLRQKFVRNTLGSVGGECDRLFAFIHPNEPLGSIKLDVAEDKKGSCNISAQFCGKDDIPPQAYYSESHADTLGFALFLALTKRRTNGDAVLIFDDIFTSVDDQHLQNVCDLVAHESGSFRQIIFTTHSRKIFDWVRTGKLPQNIFGLIELSSQWSLSDGIRARAATVERSDIEKLLKEPFLDRTRVSATTRHFLEAILSDIVMQLGATCRMKKYGDYALSDYLCALISLAKAGWQVCGRSESTGPECGPGYDLRKKATEFSQDTNVVNKLVHATDEGTSYSDSEVREFVTEVLHLDAYLRCEQCGSIVCSRKSNRSCHCGDIRMECKPRVPMATVSKQ